MENLHYDDDYPEDDCFHEDYEVDILTGIATCQRCGHRWVQTRQEIQRERKAQKEWDRMCKEWEKHGPPANPAYNLPSDDDLPF